MKLLSACLLFVLAGCAGQTVERSAQAPTIVSLNPCADAILAEVASPGQLLAISHYSHSPSASSMNVDTAARFASTGGTAEEVIALAPDVVVGDIFMPPATRAALERAGIRVEQVGIVGSLADSDAQIRQLATIAGKESAGEQLVSRIAAAWDAAGDDGAKVDTLLWQDGGIVPGDQSLALAMLEQVGFASHSAARGLGQGAYLPLEQVLADPPQLVLASGNERMLTHPTLGALKDVRYETFDSALLYCGGPTIPRALTRLLQIRASLQ